jgi:hypothetical protein
MNENRCQPIYVQSAQRILHLSEDISTTTNLANDGKLPGIGPKSILGIPVTACCVHHRDRALLGGSNDVVDVSITQTTALIRHSVCVTPLGGSKNERGHSTILAGC